MKRGKSFLRAELIGDGTDRFLNACAAADLPLRDVSCRDAVTLLIAFPARELERAEKLAALCRCELRVQTPPPGVAKRLRSRTALSVTAAICALLLSLSGLFVWDIDVVGNEKLSKGEILRALADCGVSEGCFWPAADAETVRSRMLLRCEGLAWMTLNVRGSRATVLVLERQEKPEIYAESRAADLVASRGGVVRELSVRNGKTLVARGQTVEAGQTLVSGLMDSPTGPERRVRAVGRVVAETWREQTVFLSPGARRKERSGALRLILGLRWGKNRVNLALNGRKELDECDRIVKEYTLGLGELFRFPLGLSVEVFRPFRLTEEAAPDPAAAEERILAALRAETDGELISCDFEEGEGQILLHAHSLENIAITEE